MCVLLNRTDGRTVKKVLPSLFGRWPSAEEMSSACVLDVVECIRECGLQNRKAMSLIELSGIYLKGDWVGVEELLGIGEYAGDSWRIFVEGRTDLVPRDGVLRTYLDGLEEVK